MCYSKGKIKILGHKIEHTLMDLHRQVNRAEGGTDVQVVSEDLFNEAFKWKKADLKDEKKFKW